MRRFYWSNLIHRVNRKRKQADPRFLKSVYVRLKKNVRLKKMSKRYVKKLIKSGSQELSSLIGRVERIALHGLVTRRHALCASFSSAIVRDKQEGNKTGFVYFIGEEPLATQEYRDMEEEISTPKWRI